MGNLGLFQLLLIALIALLIFGATRLPELGRSLGRGVSSLRRLSPQRSAKPSERTASRRHRGLAA